MNVIYVSCPGDPWFKVAKELQKKYNFNPIWWIGFSFDKTMNTIHDVFPNIIYQDELDAWKGRFPKEIQDKAADYYLDVDFLRKHAEHELQAIKLLDRMDQDQHSFNFMERQRHFRNLIKSWMAVIDQVKPDLVITQDMPHRIFDYTFFWLCQEKGIKYFYALPGQFVGRLYFTKNNIFSFGNRFIEDWHHFESETSDKLLEILPEDIKDRFIKVKEDYETAAPAYMEKETKLQKKSDGTFFMLKRWIRKFTTVYRPYLFGKPAGPEIVGHCAYDKRANMKYEESEGYVFQHERLLHKVNKFKKQLKKDYESLTVKPDFNEKYVVHFLHYQPERTTCPGGDIFVDQRLCVEMLLKNLPSDYKVYVKEHPHQFLRYRIGHTSRMRDLYDDLIKSNRVKLISTEESSFELIKHAQAVSTVTGTVGWEAIVRQKPVIVFGLCWYENYTKGVLRITDEASATKMLDFINSYQYDEHSFLAYLNAFAKSTHNAYWLQKQSKEGLNLTEEECVNNIISAIEDQIKNDDQS